MQISMIVASGIFGKLAFSGTGLSCRADNVGAKLGVCESSARVGAWCCVGVH